MVVGALGLAAGIAAASPINNPGDATFTFYNNPGCPFLHFSSGVNVTSYTGTATSSSFFAFTHSTGVLDFTGSAMQFHATGQVVSGQPVEVQFFINDDLGSVNLGAPVNQLNLDVTGQFRFRTTGGAISSSTCRTGDVTFHMTGKWTNTTSAGVKIPAITVGAGFCGGFAPTINSLFGLGTTGATLTMYKFSAKNDSTGLPLTGS